MQRPRVMLAYPRTFVVTCLLCGLAGCVSKSRYDHVTAAADARAQHDAEQIKELEARLTTATELAAQRDAEIVKLETPAHHPPTQLAAATSINQHLRAELTRLGKDVDSILAEKGTLSTALENAKARLEELRKAQEAAEKRIAQFKELAHRLQKQVEAHQVTVTMRGGHTMVVVACDLLFDQGKLELSAKADLVLTPLSKALREIPDRRFEVITHTDDATPSSKQAPTSWELSSLRAVEIVRRLVKSGLRPERLVAAGQGAFEPLVANDTPEHRAMNRRVEFVLLPSVDELVPLPPQTGKP
ncbi:MAG: OmpA family protein [Myxococcales bacterium]|nr:OmpA family protein [Myxococcales bacterium]